MIAGNKASFRPRAYPLHEKNNDCITGQSHEVLIYIASANSDGSNEPAVSPLHSLLVCIKNESRGRLIPTIRPQAKLDRSARAFK